MKTKIAGSTCDTLHENKRSLLKHDRAYDFPNDFILPLFAADKKYFGSDVLYCCIIREVS